MTQKSKNAKIKKKQEILVPDVQKSPHGLGSQSEPRTRWEPHVGPWRNRVYVMEPRTAQLKKIVLNRGLGDASKNTNIVESSLREFQQITGQKALIRYSKKSIAGFNIRQKTPVGISVTLRRSWMYDFLDRLIHLALPRLRDFTGLSERSFDGCGNYNFGLDEQLMFPEIHYDQIQQIRGMDIAIVTTALTDSEGFQLLQKLGLPFQKHYE